MIQYDLIWSNMMIIWWSYWIHDMLIYLISTESTAEKVGLWMLGSRLSSKPSKITAMKRFRKMKLTRTVYLTKNPRSVEENIHPTSSNIIQHHPSGSKNSPSSRFAHWSFPIPFPFFFPKINPIFLPSILPKYEKTGGTRWNRGMRIPSHTRLDDPPEFRCLSKSRHLTIDPKTSFFGLRRKEQTKPSLLKSKVAKSRVSRFISSTGTTRHDTRAEATELWELWPLEWHELHESPERAGSTGRLQNAWVWRMSILALLTDHFCWCQWSLIFEKIETPDTPHNPEKMTSPTCHSFAHSISNHSS